MSIESLIKSLKEGVVTVVFEKIDTKEIRSMACTLNQRLSTRHSTSVNSLGNATTIVMYALDKEAWRDVRVNTIKDWYKGYPKET